MIRRARLRGAWLVTLSSSLGAVSLWGPRPLAPEVERAATGATEGIAVASSGCRLVTRPPTERGAPHAPAYLYAQCAPTAPLTDAWWTDVALTPPVRGGERLVVSGAAFSCATPDRCRVFGIPWQAALVERVTPGYAEPAGALILVWYQQHGLNLRAHDLARLFLASGLGLVIVLALRRTAAWRRSAAAVPRLAALLAGAGAALCASARPLPWGGAADLPSSIAAAVGGAVAAWLILAIVRARATPHALALGSLLAFALVEAIAASARERALDARDMQVGLVAVGTIVALALPTPERAARRALYAALTLPLVGLVCDGLALAPTPLPAIEGIHRPWQLMSSALGWVVFAPVLASLVADAEQRALRRRRRGQPALSLPLLLVSVGAEKTAHRGMLAVELREADPDRSPRGPVSVTDAGRPASRALEAAARAVVGGIDARLSASGSELLRCEVRFEHAGSALIGRSFELALALAWAALRLGRVRALRRISASACVASDREHLEPSEDLEVKLLALSPGETLLISDRDGGLASPLPPDVRVFDFDRARPLALLWRRWRWRRHVRRGARALVAVDSVTSAMRTVFGD